jgi:hypothetical protein
MKLSELCPTTHQLAKLDHAGRDYTVEGGIVATYLSGVYPANELLPVQALVSEADALYQQHLWINGMAGTPELIINHHCDAGHGWFEVSWALVQALGIEYKITAYSYQEADRVYLEEDCDGTTLMGALVNKSNLAPQFNHISYAGDAPMRSMRKYSPSL